MLDAKITLNVIKVCCTTASVANNQPAGALMEPYHLARGLILRNGFGRPDGSRKERASGIFSARPMTPSELTGSAGKIPRCDSQPASFLRPALTELIAISGG